MFEYIKKNINIYIIHIYLNINLENKLYTLHRYQY